MDKGWLLIGVIAGVIFGIAFFLSVPAESLITSVPPTRPPYAQLSDSTTQPCISGSAKNITLNTNDSIYGMTHSTTANAHEIKIKESGTYLVLAVPQIGEASVQADGVHDFWMTRNNIRIPNTNIKTHIMVTAIGDETITGTLNWVGYLKQNDIISFQQGCSDSDIGIIATPAGVPPATPSIIISIVKLNW